MSDVWGNSSTWTTDNNVSSNRGVVQPSSNSAQKATNPVKLTFPRTALISSLQSVVDAKNTKFTADTAAVDANLALAQVAVDANADAIAKNFGFATTDNFKNSISYKETISSVARSMGFNTSKPNKPNTSRLESDIAVLTLATGDTIELEEGHQFLSHLQK